jgi:hypothetical protein
MGSEFHIEVDAVDMFAGHDWIDLGDECGHDCTHNAMSVVGWGPDVAHYELNECDLCGCRAWLDGRYYQERHRDPAKAAFWWRQMDWRNANTHPFFAAEDRGQTHTQDQENEHG